MSPISALYPLQHFIPYLRSASKQLYNVTPPTDQYADRVFWQLLITLCHESDHLRARRQYLPNHLIDTHIGAFGLMQCEIDSIRRSIADLLSKPRLYDHCYDWVISNDGTMPAIKGSIDNVLGLLRRPEGDLASIMFGRLHYFRVPAPIPATLPQMAAYSKQHYNSLAGKALPFDYIASTLQTMKESRLL